MVNFRKVLPGLLALAALAGCSQYEPFDSAAHVKEQYEELLPPDLAGQVEVPFVLSLEVREQVEALLSPTGDEKRRVQEIVDYIFSGLDLQYSLLPTRNADETFIARSGNCLSFVNLFVAIARQQRLNPFFVEVEDYQRWNYSDGVVVSRGHIVAGMNVDGELSTFDFLPYRPKAYKDFDPIDDLTAMAHYYNNLGAEALIRGEVATAEPYLTIANRLAPDFEKAMNNLGIVLLRTGQTDEAVALYERGLAIHPDNVPLLNNLARAFQDGGRQEDAMALLDRMEQINQTNPFVFIYRGEIALAAGDEETALEFMRQALRTDSEIPEVHVGLAKVFIARGQLDRAQHHVERALKLDATHDEARRYAALLNRHDG
jgi:tetratricopeptide (TPR) repeat protein